MDKIQENVVNIAMTAGRMKRQGIIDTQGGHTELAGMIIELADEFEREVASKIDYNAPPDFNNLRDYWVEIDEFAERRLLEMFDDKTEYDVNAVINRLKDLALDRQSFFREDGDDDVFREDYAALLKAVELLEEKRRRMPNEYQVDNFRIKQN